MRQGRVTGRQEASRADEMRDPLFFRSASLELRREKSSVLYVQPRWLCLLVFPAQDSRAWPLRRAASQRESRILPSLPKQVRRRQTRHNGHGSPGNRTAVCCLQSHQRYQAPKYRPAPWPSDTRRARPLLPGRCQPSPAWGKSWRQTKGRCLAIPQDHGYWVARWPDRPTREGSGYRIRRCWLCVP